MDKNELKQLAESDLLVFAQLVNPNRVYGDVHKELFNWWTRENSSDNQLVLLPRDHQKVLPWNCPVLMADGSWKETGELYEGDLLADPDTGKSQEVSQLHPIDIDDYYKITLDDGREIDCGAGHLWEIEQHGFKTDNPIVRDTLWIKNHYQKERYEPRTGNYFTEYKTAIKASVPLEFGEKELPIPPYVLGVWLGDGTQSSAQLTSCNDEIPNLVQECGFSYTRHRKKYSYNITGLSALLKTHNLINNKHIPLAYLQGSVEQRLELLQGLLDTDGSVNKRNGITIFSQCERHESIVDDVIYLVRSLGGKAKKSFHQTKYEKGGKFFNSVSVNIWLPKELPAPFKVGYKKSLYENVSRFQKQMLKSFIHNIEYVGRKSSRCITVSNPRGLYVAKDFIPTHNSHMMAVRAAWTITCDPSATILYISATSDLAQKQLYAIKNILISPAYRRYWPEMTNIQEGKREIWNAMEIAVDHPRRKEEGVRDPTVKAAGLTTNVTGLHASYVCLDDIVVPDNAYTEEGRSTVRRTYSQLASIETTGAKEWVVGTRYHPDDIYSDLKEMKETTFDQEGEIDEEVAVYEVFEKVVETEGNFLWPKEYRSDGKPFGFDQKELARKRAKYLDTAQFYAQYYNNPNDPESQRLDRTKFQYINEEFLNSSKGVWYYRGKRLSITAAADLAFTINKTSDFTAIVVVGMDSEGYIYVLDTIRFKTDKYDKYYEEIESLFQKWRFKKLLVETNAGGTLVSSYIKEQIRRTGMGLVIEEQPATKKQGSKEERIAAILEPRYENMDIFHVKGGMTNILENELVLSRPKNDDLKDALAAAVSIAKPAARKNNSQQPKRVVEAASRFGGVAR